jgi:hypothetical protein
MDWKYYVESDISKCLTNSLLISSFVIFWRVSSEKYYKTLMILNNKTLNSIEKIFIKNYLLTDFIFKTNWKYNPSIVKNTDLRIFMIVSLSMFSNLAIYNILSSNKFFTIKNNINTIFSSTISFMISGYLIFGFNLIICFGLIGFISGFVNTFTKNFLISRNRKKLEF